MSDAKELEKVAVIAAGARLFSQIPQLAGMVAGLTAFAYLIGWREVSAYYAHLGAPWAAGLLPSSVVMQTSVDSITVLAMTCFFSFHLYSSGSIGSKGLLRALMVSTAIAIVAVAISALGHKWFSADIVNKSAKAAAGMWAVYAGLMFTFLIVGLAEKGLQWDAHHLLLAYLVLFIGCWAAPAQLGKARAMVDADPAASALPTVLTKDLPHGPRWKLVAAIEGHLFLLQPANGSLPSRFRLAKSDEVDFVHAAPVPKPFTNGE